MDFKKMMGGMDVEKSPLLGAGTPSTGSFDDMERFCKSTNPNVTQIVVRKGSIIDRITFVCGNTAFEHGGNGGTEYRFDLEQGETIVKVEGTHSKFKGKTRIADIVFHTNKGRKLESGRPNGGERFSYSAKSGSHICCMYGNADQYIERIGFYEVKLPAAFK